MNKRFAFFLNIVVLLVIFNHNAIADAPEELIIDNANDLQIVNDVVTLTNHNIDGNYEERYQNVDYIIATSLEFGGDNGIQADLVIEDGVEIWFNLDITSYGEEDTEADINGDIEVYNITISTSQNFDSQITCGDSEGDPVVIKPNPDYSLWGDNQYLWFGYPTTDQNNPNEVWAGGFIIHSTGNTFENTSMDHMIGNSCHVQVYGVNPQYYDWNVDEGDCFAIELATQNASVSLGEDTEISLSFFEGIVMSASTTTLNMDKATITHTRNPSPHVENPEHDFGNTSAGDGIYVADGTSGCSITATDTSGVTENEHHGIYLDGVNHTVSFSDYSSISHNGSNGNGNGIHADGNGQHTININDDSRVNGNDEHGIFAIDGNTISIGFASGGCSVDSNRVHGIQIRGSDNTINVDHSSSVSYNGNNGIEISCSSARVHEDDMPADNTVNIDNASIVNYNGFLNPDPPDGNGIYLLRTDRTLIAVKNASKVDENLLNGISGEDSWWADVLVNNADVTGNGKCGILFNASTIHETDVGYNCGDQEPSIELDEEDVYCADCSVTLDNGAEVNLNEGVDNRDAGIAMYGLGNEIMVKNASEVSENLSHGIRAYAFDFNNVEIMGNSIITSNGGEGVWVQRTRITSLDDSEIGDNDANGILTEWFTLYRAMDPDPDPRGEEDKMVYGVNLRDNDDEVNDYYIHDNGANGIKMYGSERTLQTGYSIDISQTTVARSGENGIVVASIDRANEDDFVMSDCLIRDNTENGIEFSGQFSTIGNEGILVLEGTTQGSFEITQNDLNGIEITENEGVAEFIFTNLDINSNEEAGLEIGDPRANFPDPFFIRLDNIELSQNDNGVYFAETDDNHWPVKLEVYGCLFEQNTCGIYVDNHFGAWLWIAPEVPDYDYTVEKEITVFDSNTNWGIYIDDYVGEFQQDEGQTCLLVDRCQFNDYSDVVGTIPPQPIRSGIKIIGEIAGWDAEGDPCDEAFGTIRKCLFGYANYGVYLETKTVGQNDFHPLVHVRNNFFVDEAIGVRVDFTEQVEEDVLIYNNTFLGDEQPNAVAGIYIDDPDPMGGDPALDDNTIYSNLFEGLDVGINQLHAGVSPDYPCQGFFNNTTNMVNCESDGNQLLNPLRISANSERLFWNSPMINSGDGDGVEDSTLIDDDGEEELIYATRADIGCTGGGFYAGILNHKPYNVIDDVTTAGNMTLITQNEGDDYEVVTKLLVNPNHALTIGEQTAIYIHADDEIKIRGSINADGHGAGPDEQEDTEDDIFDLVTFDKYPGESRWTWLYIYQPTANCELDGCRILNADYNVYAYGGVEEEPNQLVIVKCDIGYGDYYNMYISGDIRVHCNESTIHDALNNGVYIRNNDLLSSFDLNLITGNGHNSWDSGVRINDSTPLFTCNCITDNYNHGVLCYSLGHIVLNGDGEIANDIYNNGWSLDQDDDYVGAEICLRSDSEPTIQWNNIWDIDWDDGTRYGKLISKIPETNGDVRLIVDNNWWGEDDEWIANVDEIIIDPDDQDYNMPTYFYWEAQPENPVSDSILADDKANAYLEGYGMDPPPEPDDLDFYMTGLTLQEEGAYLEAAEYYVRHIMQDPREQFVFNSLSRILTCYRKGQGSLLELNRLYGSWGVEFAESHPRLSWEAKRMAYFCQMYARENGSAFDRMRSLLDEAPTSYDSLLVELDMVYVQEIMDNRVDRAYYYAQESERLEQLLEAYGDRNIAEESGLPTEFHLSNAYPNPFNSSCCFVYQVPEPEHVNVSVFDLTGRLVETLVDDPVKPGSYKLVWSAQHRPSGVYFCRLKAGGYTGAIKLNLVR